MAESLWLLIFSVLVVIAVSLFRRYVMSTTGYGSLLITVIACVIAAAADTFIVGGKLFGFIAAALIIYAVSNLIFQALTLHKNV